MREKRNTRDTQLSTNLFFQQDNGVQPNQTAERLRDGTMTFLQRAILTVETARIATDLTGARTRT